MMACHARHSGGEALFLTPAVMRDVGVENASLEYEAASYPPRAPGVAMYPVEGPNCSVSWQGDICFCYEPTGVCQHATEDASEVPSALWLTST